MRHFIFLNYILVFAVSFILTACTAVGPDYKPPNPKTPAKWHVEPQDGLTAGTLDIQFLSGWWSALDDATLSQLMNAALSANLDLKKAVARVREARARRGIQQAGQFPSLDVAGSVTQSRSSANSGIGLTRELYQTGFDAAWEMDVFGGKRRSVEAAEADLQSAVEDRYAAMVSLTAELALNYVDVRTFQARQAAAEANLKIQEETVDIINARYQAGLDTELAVQQARYNLESTRAQLPSLRVGLSAAQNRLALLTGQPPGSVHGVLNQHAPIPAPPLSVVVGVPAEALRNRPDVRKAERDLAAQTARIGVATADLYPKFRLSGAIGLEATEFNNWFQSSSRSWSYGPGVSWNLFDAGAIRQNIEVQSALQEQALIQYESVILSALEEVENALLSFVQEQLRRESLAAATEAAQSAVKLAQDQYTAGIVDFSTVLDAQRSLLSFQDQLTQSEGTVTADLVRLYKSVGGGWTPLSPTDAISDKNQKDAAK